MGVTEKLYFVEMMYENKIQSKSGIHTKMRGICREKSANESQTVATDKRTTKSITEIIRTFSHPVKSNVSCTRPTLRVFLRN